VKDQQHRQAVGAAEKCKARLEKLIKANGKMRTEEVADALKEALAALGVAKKTKAEARKKQS